MIALDLLQGANGGDDVAGLCLLTAGKADV
jgi:hypothetical protein